MDDSLALLQDNLTLVITGILLFLLVLVFCYGILIKMQKRMEVAAIRSEIDKEIQRKQHNASISKNAQSHQNNPAKSKSTDSKMPDRTSADPSLDLSLLGYKIQKARQMVRDKQVNDELNETSQNLVEAGNNAINDQRWDLARKYFEEAQKLSHGIGDLNIKLAIVCFEQADLTASEKYYEEAFAKHPHARNLFYKHLAFRI